MFAYSIHAGELCPLARTPHDRDLCPLTYTPSTLATVGTVRMWISWIGRRSDYWPFDEGSTICRVQNAEDIVLTVALEFNVNGRIARRPTLSYPHAHRADGR